MCFQGDMVGEELEAIRTSFIIFIYTVRDIGILADKHRKDDLEAVLAVD